LRVYGLVGDVLSLGRYHLAPTGDPAGQMQLHRRIGGGRVLPLGPGFAVLSLTLPHRAALVAEDPLALRPEQVLNRCVRAVLSGLRSLGVEVFYPGRDRLTVAGRALGWVSLESDQRGATMFEALLAIDGDWSDSSARIGAVDPDGVLAVELIGSDQVTTLSDHGARPPLDELAQCLADAYAQQFGLAHTAGAVPSPPPDAAARAASWIVGRRRYPGLDHHAAEWGQLGVFEVYLAARKGVIEEVICAGDFIADSPSIERLEKRLRGCALAPDAVAAVVDGVYADPHSFLLGLGPLRTVVETILRAA
jgi:hypothetical protein